MERTEASHVGLTMVSRTEFPCQISCGQATTRGLFGVSSLEATKVSYREVQYPRVLLEIRAPSRDRGLDGMNPARTRKSLTHPSRGRSLELTLTVTCIMKFTANAVSPPLSKCEVPLGSFECHRRKP